MRPGAVVRSPDSEPADPGPTVIPPGMVSSIRPGTSSQAGRGVLGFIAEAQAIASIDTLSDRFLEVVAPFGLHTAMYLKLASPGRPVSPRVLFGHGDAAWAEAYSRHNCAEHDPAVPHIFARAAPFAWSDVNAASLGNDQRRVLALAAGFGHADGLVVPLLGPAGDVRAVVMTSAHRLVLGPRERAIIAAAASAFAARGLELAAGQVCDPVPLTRRERQCLAWAAQGKSDWVIGEILALSQTTVHMHVENARRKLGGRSRFHAALEAWKHGWLIGEEG